MEIDENSNTYQFEGGGSGYDGAGGNSINLNKSQ
jgi:hypothetical protein